MRNGAGRRHSHKVLIIRRFAAEGKGIELNAVQRLINVSGELMNGLIPEINKIASYTKGDRVTEADVDAVAHHIPEAVVFDMTEALAKGENNAAMRLLGELLADKNNEPTMTLCHCRRPDAQNVRRACCH